MRERAFLSQHQHLTLSPARDHGRITQRKKHLTLSRTQLVGAEARPREPAGFSVDQAIGRLLSVCLLSPIWSNRGFPSSITALLPITSR